MTPSPDCNTVPRDDTVPATSLLDSTGLMPGAVSAREVCRRGNAMKRGLLNIVAVALCISFRFSAAESPSIKSDVSISDDSPEVMPYDPLSGQAVGSYILRKEDLESLIPISLEEYIPILWSEPPPNLFWDRPFLDVPALDKILDLPPPAILQIRCSNWQSWPS